jgi:non-ribosomal peptide synthetase component E (peptide arylation enzyme)
LQVTVPADDGDARDRAEHWYATGVYGHVTLPQAVLAASSARPDLPIVFDSATRRAALTLEELVGRASRCAAAFHSLGVGPGDAVAVQVPSWAEGAVAQAAALLAGAVRKTELRQRVRPPADPPASDISA